MKQRENKSLLCSMNLKDMPKEMLDMGSFLQTYKKFISQEIELLERRLK